MASAERFRIALGLVKATSSIGRHSTCSHKKWRVSANIARVFALISQFVVSARTLTGFRLGTSTKETLLADGTIVIGQAFAFSFTFLFWLAFFGKAVAVWILALLF